jgi:hypothetical protein
VIFFFLSERIVQAIGKIIQTTERIIQAIGKIVQATERIIQATAKNIIPRSESAACF